MQLLLPDGIRNSDNQRPAIEPEGYHLVTQALARDALPGKRRRGLEQLLVTAGRGQKFGQ